MKTAAKRLALCLLALSSLGGCAVYGYGPGYPSGYYDSNPYGQPVYSAPPAYAAPVYVGPPVFFSFGYRSGGGFRDGGRGFRDGGHRGFRDGGHR